MFRIMTDLSLVSDIHDVNSKDIAVTLDIMELFLK